MKIISNVDFSKKCVLCLKQSQPSWNKYRASPRATKGERTHTGVCVWWKNIGEIVPRFPPGRSCQPLRRNHPLSICYSSDDVWSHWCNQNKLVKSASILLAQSEMEMSVCVCVCVCSSKSLVFYCSCTFCEPNLQCSYARQSQTSVQGANRLS